MRAKKILITGADGYIGSSLAGSLAEEKGIELALVGGPNSKNNAVFSRLVEFCAEKKAKAEFESADILDSEKISRMMKGADAVIHIAAVHTIDACEKKPEESRRVNVEGTHAIVKLAEKSGAKKFIYPSSFQVCLGSKAKKITEKTSPVPLNEYARQKLAAEKIIQNSKMDYIILRKSNVFGLGFTQQFDTVVPAFVRSAISNKKIEVFGKGTQERNFLHIKDAIQAYKKAIFSDYKGILNIGGQKQTKIIWLANIVAKKLGAEIVHVENPRKEPEKHWVFSIEKAKKILDYNPKTSLEKGLDEFIEWAEQNREIF